MKKVLYLMAALMLLPVGASAQDDMYFTSSSKTKKAKKESAYKAAKMAEKTEGLDADTVKYRTYDDDDVIYNGDGVEDDAVPNDTLYIDPYETFSDGQGEWVGGFHGTVDDYLNTKRQLQWTSMSAAIPVGSSLYWNLVYGPYSLDWNIYKVGGLAYVTPTWSNPMYTSFQYTMPWGWGIGRWWRPWYNSWYSPYWGGIYDPWDPWYYSRYSWGFGGWGFGWHSGFYDPFFGPYWGGGFYHSSWGWGYPGGIWYSGHPMRSRDNGRYHSFGRDNAVRLGSTNRSALRDRSDVHRITDNRAQQRQATRAGGHSVQRSTGSESSSVRSTARNLGRERNSNGAETRSMTPQTRSNQDARMNRSTTTRSNSTYTRSADGRTRSTYTRPSSTRSIESGSGVAPERSVTRSNGVRSMSESRN